MASSADLWAVPAHLQPTVDDFMPLARRHAGGRYAIAVGGSMGKGASDAESDVDLRMYADEITGSWAEIGEPMRALMDKWTARGVRVDGIWMRKVADIERVLAGWLDGSPQAQPLVWAVWGYHLLPDLYHQRIIEDPYGLVAGWKERLRIYPPVLKAAILARHMESLRYWRNDYHYASKVRRGDVVFLASLSARLVHDLMQVLYALNEVYFVGDGQNLQFAAHFARKPADLVERVTRALYPAPSERMFEQQRDELASLIDDVERLVAGDG